MPDLPAELMNLKHVAVGVHERRELQLIVGAGDSFREPWVCYCCLSKDGRIATTNALSQNFDIAQAPERVL